MIGLEIELLRLLSSNFLRITTSGSSSLTSVFLLLLAVSKASRRPGNVEEAPNSASSEYSGKFSKLPGFTTTRYVPFLGVNSAFLSRSSSVVKLEKLGKESSVVVSNSKSGSGAFAE